MPLIDVYAFAGLCRSLTTSLHQGINFFPSMQFRDKTTEGQEGQDRQNHGPKT